MRLCVGLLALLFTTSLGNVFATNATEILIKAENAESKVSYRGIKTADVSVYGRSVQSKVKVIHKKPFYTRREYLSPCTLAGTILLQKKNELWRYCPSKGFWELITKKAPISRFTPITQTAIRNFNVELVGIDSVAGRSVYVIRAEPKYTGEAIHTLLIDREHFLVLGTREIGPMGRTSKSQYISIEFNPKNISNSLFEVDTKTSTRTAPSKEQFVVVKPTYLPRGYVQIGYESITINGKTTFHLQYSNGANIISLFERKVDAGTTIGKAQCPPNTKMWKDGNILFTLVGDIDSTELDKIKNSIKVR